MSMAMSVQSHPAQEATLAGILTSLFVVQPPTLAPDQLSDNVKMRHRLLGLPSTPPEAYDMEARSKYNQDHAFLGSSETDTTISDAEKEKSRLALIDWLVTSIEPTTTTDRSQCLKVIEIEFFALRRNLRSLKLNSGIDIEQQIVWSKACSCSQDSHGEGRRFVVLKAPIPKSPILCLTMNRSPDGSERFDNISATSGSDLDKFGVPKVQHSPGLHVWTTRCDRHQHQQQQQHQQDNQQDQDQVAEYISNADDFWAGYSDEEQVDARTINSKAARTGLEEESADDYWNSYDRQVQDGDISFDDPLPSKQSQRPLASISTTSDDEAVKDVVRGAYKLFTSAHPDVNTREHFMALVHAAIPNESISR